MGGSRVVVMGGWAGFGGSSGGFGGRVGGGRCLEPLPGTLRRSGAGGLIEVELGDGLWLSRVGCGRLVEVVGGQGDHVSDGIGVQCECGLGWRPVRGRVVAACEGARDVGGWRLRARGR
jgi:hypothetical protein